MDRKSLFEGAPDFTAELLTHYYARNLDSFFDTLDDEVMWIGPLRHQFAVGKEKVKDFFQMEQGIVFRLTESEFQLVSSDVNSCVVIGWMEICTDGGSSCALKCRQRASLVFKAEEDRLSVTHIHLSESWDMFDNEAFPFRLSMQTYDHMQQLLKNKTGNDGKLTVYDTKRRVHFILESEIIYVESSNIHCQLYCVNGRVLITENISKFQERLSRRFIRIHRSYIINVDYVIGMERFAVRLCDGISIPIPEKKYVKLRKEISELLPIGPSEQA